MCHPSISDESTLTSTSWKRVPCPKHSSTPKLFQLWSKGWWFDCDIKSQPFENFWIFRSRPTNLTISAPHHLESASQSAPKMTALTCGVWPAVSTRPRITKLYQIQVTPSFCWDLVMCVWIPFQQTCDALFDCFLGMIHWTHWKLLEGLQKIRRAWSGPHWKMDVIQMLKVHRFEMCYMLYLLGPPPFRMVIVLNDNTSFHKWQFETFKNSDCAFGVRLHKYVYLEKMCI